MVAKRRVDTEGTTSLLEWAGAKKDPATGQMKPKPRAAKRTTIAASSFNRTLVETEHMMESGEWGACSARHIVALYKIMHEKVYGVAPSLSGSELYRATLLVGNFVKREFGGEYERSIEYFRWAWVREKERETWRRENGRDGQCIGLPLLCSGTFITQYRVAMARRRRA